MADNATETKNETSSYEGNRTYLVKIDTIRAVESKNKKTPGFRISVVGSAGEVEGERLTDTVWITDKTKWKMTNLLAAAGVEKLTGRDDVTLFKLFSGKEVLIKTQLEEGTDNGLGGKYPDMVRISNFIGGSPSSSEDSANAGDVPF